MKFLTWILLILLGMFIGSGLSLFVSPVCSSELPEYKPPTNISIADGFIYKDGGKCKYISKYHGSFNIGCNIVIGGKSK